MTKTRIFFDTETSGLPKDWGLWPERGNVHFFPYVLQLAWIITEGERVVQTCSFIISQGNSIKIDQTSIDVHGIDHEKMNHFGIGKHVAFNLFFPWANIADEIVCHNANFDIKMMEAERIRTYPGSIDKLDLSKTVCTMQESTDVMKLPGNYGYKWPKLSELHHFLFDKDFEGAHDALNDVQATMRCFFEIERRKEAGTWETT